jgi:uncharacterized membrane protein YhdT
MRSRSAQHELVCTILYAAGWLLIACWQGAQPGALQLFVSLCCLWVATHLVVAVLLLMPAACYL